MSPWVIVGAGAVTLALRASMVLGQAPTWEQRAEPYLRRLPAAVLPALAASTLASQVATPDGGLRLVAALIGIVVARRTRSLLITLVAGLVVLHALHLSIG